MTRKLWRIEPTKELISHPLWQGSILQQKHALNILEDIDVDRRIAAMKRCDDLSYEERTFLQALQETSDNEAKGWEF